MILKLKKFKWLRLSAALATFMILVTAFTGLLEEVREGDTSAIDERILLAVNTTSTPFWDSFFLFVTDLGGLPIIAAATLLMIALLFRAGRKYLAAFVAVTVAGAGLINLTLKALIGRERPSLWEQLIIESSYSFPSGHAMASSALALCVILISYRTRFWWPAVVLSIIYAVLVGYSRMYLGVHYPSDVVAGWLVSSAWFMTVGAILYGRQWRKRQLQQALKQTG